MSSKIGGLIIQGVLGQLVQADMTVSVWLAYIDTAKTKTMACAL